MAGEPTVQATPEDNPASLVVYDAIGDSFAGTVFNADLQRDGESIGLVAKFYDPDTAELNDQNEESVGQLSIDVPEADKQEAKHMKPSLCLPNEEKEWSFRNEIATYERLSNTDICPRFFGALQGIGLTGSQTGIILIEKLPVTFNAFEEMTACEREVAYGHVVELHRRGIHHGDVFGGNFGRREEPPTKKGKSKTKRTNDRSSIVICDFSHSTNFENCDPEECWELRQARQTIIELAVPGA